MHGARTDGCLDSDSGKTRPARGDGDRSDNTNKRREGMRSAYLVLGVPGDASREEIEAAFRRAEVQFPRGRLAEEDGALARWQEIRAAYQVLNDPGSRAAHDRKLQAQVSPPARPRTVVVTQEAAPLRKLIVAGVWLLVLVLAAGVYVNHRNTEARRVLVEHETAQRMAAEREAEARRQEQERIAAQRAAQQAKAEAEERRLRMDSQVFASQAAANLRMQEAAAAQAARQERAEAQRLEAERANEERRAAAEARQRADRDKQRVREICLRVYGRPDC